MNQVISFFKRRRGNNSFEELVAPYIDILFRQAYQYTGKESDAEDLVQELLIELYQKQDKLLAANNLKAWLTRCLYHRFVDSYRKKKSQPSFADIEEQKYESKLPAIDSPDKDYWHHQVIDGLGSLSHEQRMVICLHDIEGHTIAEIATIMQLPIGTLKSHLHRGRATMKRKLDTQPFTKCERLQR